MNFPNIQQQKYLKELSKKSKLKLCIIGQDIYPEDASGIAFCKNKFEQLLSYNCSGKYVLKSLGYDLDYFKNEKKISTEELFIELLNKGICFINISYELLTEIPIEQLEDSLSKFKTFNKFFLEKSDNIVLLGKTTTLKLFNKNYSEYTNFETLIHPSPRNKSKLEWKEIYEKPFLKDKYML